MGIDRRSGVGGGESGGRQEWKGRRRVGTDRGSGVGGERVEKDRRRGGVGWGEIRDGQDGECGGRGREWG